MRRVIAGAGAALLLGGCASLAIDENLAAVDRFSQERTGAEVRWLRSDAERVEMADEVDRLLARPLAADDAVRIALAYSPAFQVVLAEAAATSAEATRSARLPNPVFSFERLVRSDPGGRDLDIGRALSFSLLDLLLLPARAERAQFRQEQTRLEASAALVALVAEVRQAWVQAVAAAQTAGYQEAVVAAAEAGAELARRMEAVGNFSRLQRAREQTAYADAAAQLARARLHATASREALVRRLGLPAAQAARLALPDRLPDLPATLDDGRVLAQDALEARLDLRIARADLEATARELGLARTTSAVEHLEVAAIRNSETGKSAQRGFELELPLPLFDFGDAARAGGQARYLAALNRTAQVAAEATSQVRESHAAWRTAHEIARHYRDELVPLRARISDEMLLQYNGMLIGVFELLADARARTDTVIQAIEAERDFWLADAALDAALIGTPASLPALRAPAAGAGDAGAAGH